MSSRKQYDHHHFAGRYREGWRDLSRDFRRTSIRGETAGEALDALTSQLNEEEASTLVIVQNHRPDRFFTAQQQERLGKLMARWRSARDGGSALKREEQAELDALIEAELNAAMRRAESALKELGQ